MEHIVSKIKEGLSESVFFAVGSGIAFGTAISRSDNNTHLSIGLFITAGLLLLLGRAVGKVYRELEKLS